MLATLPRCWASSLSGARLALLGACVSLLIVCGHASAQPAPPLVTATDREIADLVQKIEAAIGSSDAKAFNALLAPDTDRASADTFVTLQIRPGITRAVLRERDRLPVTDLPDGTAYVLIIDTFVQFGERGSVSTWRLDVRRWGW